MLLKECNLCWNITTIARGKEHDNMDRMIFLSPKITSRRLVQVILHPECHISVRRNLFRRHQRTNRFRRWRRSTKGEYDISPRTGYPKPNTILTEKGEKQSLSLLLGNGYEKKEQKRFSDKEPLKCKQTQQPVTMSLAHAYENPISNAKSKGDHHELRFRHLIAFSV